MAANSAYFKVDAPISVSSVESDVISEKTSAAGVTVDGCLIKDGRAALLATNAMFLSTEQTGTGAPQNVAHGMGAIPTLAFAIPSDLTGGVCAIVYGTHTTTNVVVTVTSGEKFRIVAIK